MLDHVGIPVSEFERSRRFYERALSPLGYEVIMEPDPFVVGLGLRGKPDFWFAQGERGHTVHVAFAADDRDAVDAFYEAAIAADGRDNGRPGLRPRYHSGYYAAFVREPGGNNVEAACHGRES